MNLLLALVLPIVHLQHVLAAQEAQSSSARDHTLTCPRHSYISFNIPEEGSTVDPNWPYPSVEGTYAGLNKEGAIKKWEKEGNDLRQTQLTKMATCNLVCTQRFLKWEKEKLPEIMGKKGQSMMSHLQAVQEKEVQLKRLEESRKKEEEGMREKERLKAESLTTVYVVETTEEEAAEVTSFLKSLGVDDIFDSKPVVSSPPQSLISTTTADLRPPLQTPPTNLSLKKGHATPSPPKDLVTANFLESTELQSFISGIRETIKPQSKPTPKTIFSINKNASMIIEGDT